MTDSVVSKLKQIIAEDLDVDLKVEEIDEKVPLFEEGLGLDSVVLVELISLIERRFGFEFEDEDLNVETFHNIQSLAAIIEKDRTLQEA